MVAGMKFLSKKGFNPQNTTNQKRVWEARESKKREEEKIRERQDQLKRERDDEELSRARGEPIHLKFMYAPPPGMEAGTKVNSEPDQGDSISKEAASSGSTDDITQVQAGDDAAAAAFRRLLAAASSGNKDGLDDDEMKPQSTQEDRIGDGTVLQGTSIEKESKGKNGLSALEKAVGRRDGNQSLSLDEQVARFPQLKDAPMAKGMTGSQVGVSFKPLGAQLRNVRCLACGIWGHSRGERECPKSGWNPFALTAPAAAAATLPTKQQEGHQSTKEVNQREKPVDRSYSSQSATDSESEDSYRERKRRKKSKRKHCKKESKKSKRRSRSESPERKRRRRSRSDSPEQERSRSRKSSKSRRKKSSRRY